MNLGALMECTEGLSVPPNSRTSYLYLELSQEPHNLKTSSLYLKTHFSRTSYLHHLTMGVVLSRPDCVSVCAGQSPYPNVVVDAHFYKMIKAGRHMSKPDYATAEM